MKMKTNEQLKREFFEAYFAGFARREIRQLLDVTDETICELSGEKSLPSASRVLEVIDFIGSKKTMTTAQLRKKFLPRYSSASLESILRIGLRSGRLKRIAHGVYSTDKRRKSLPVKTRKKPVEPAVEPQPITTTGEIYLNSIREQRKQFFNRIFGWVGLSRQPSSQGASLR